jgi:hypothetical protein
MASNKITSLANGTNAGDAVAFNQLKLIQVKSATVANAFSTTSLTFTDTYSVVTITPTSASNSIFIVASGELGYSSAGNSAYVTLARGGNNLAGTDGISAYNGVVGATPACITFLDAPGTTSPVTYSVQIRTGSGNVVTWNRTNTTSTITVFELAI